MTDIILEVVGKRGENKSDWVCPLCNSGNYANIGRIGINQVYCCNGCSILFLDPASFAKNGIQYKRWWKC